MKDERGETADSLIQTAAAHGYRVSPVMLKKWRDAGLIPRPVQRSLGRGKGTVAFYPDGSTTQFLRLLAIRAEGGRFNPERSLWRLWWEGWPVDQDRLRKTLHAALETLETCLRAFSEDDALVDRFQTDRLPPFLLKARKRAGTPAMPTVAVLVGTMLAGDAPRAWQDADDASTLLRSLGLDRTVAALAPDAEKFNRELAGDLHRFGNAVAPSAIHAALDELSDAGIADARLADARDELHAMVRIVGWLLSILSAFLPTSNAGRDMLSMSAGDAFDALPYALLYMLALRRAETYRRLFDWLRQTENMVSLTAALANGPIPDKKKLPRRRQPSGSAAQEVGFPCTMSLASSPPPRSGMASSH